MGGQSIVRAGVGKRHQKKEQPAFLRVHSGRSCSQLDPMNAAKGSVFLLLFLFPSCKRASKTLWA
jgi:hypothetical protein